MKAKKSIAVQSKMFQFIDMESLVPEKHILRQLDQVIDLSGIYDRVSRLYTERTGRPATNPELMVRLILLSYLFDHSERELYQILPMHAGYLWFCGLDFESVQQPEAGAPTLPDRTTLVKTRKLWRQQGIFDQLMIDVVKQCIASGLVKPDVHASVDGTQVRANASIHSLQDIQLAPVESIESYLIRVAEEDEHSTEPAAQDQQDSDDPPASGSSSGSRMEEQASHEDFHGKTFSNRTHRSVTDPEARLYKKSKGQEAYLRYLVHNVIDAKTGVILSTAASQAHGQAERSVSLQQLDAIRFQHPGLRIQTLSADKAYGTTEYLKALHDRDIVSLVSLRHTTLEEIPTWQRKTHDPERQRKRQIKVEEAEIRNWAKRIQLHGRYRDIQRLRTRSEHVYAESKGVHGMDRARSRGLDCMHEQAVWTAIVQNLKRLCRFKGKRPQTGCSACHSESKPRLDGSSLTLYLNFRALLCKVLMIGQPVRMH